jgi:hypothetical protein
MFGVALSGWLASSRGASGGSQDIVGKKTGFEQGIALDESSLVAERPN